MNEIPKIPPVVIIKDVFTVDPNDYELPEMKIVITNPNLPYCIHEQINVFPYHRKIICRTCGALLDPFDYLYTVGLKENYQLSEVKHLMTIAKQLREEIETLKRQKQNLKRTLKNGNTHPPNNS